MPFQSRFISHDPSVTSFLLALQERSHEPTRLVGFACLGAGPYPRPHRFSYRQTFPVAHELFLQPHGTRTRREYRGNPQLYTGIESRGLDQFLEETAGV